jgi:magnesium-transporting ATPase (P-type)
MVEMNLGTNLFIAYLIYFVSTYIKLVTDKDKRKEHQVSRERMRELRDVAVKTKEQQKEFLDLKYPKTPPFQWSFINVSKIVLKLIVMIGIFILTRYLWKTYIKILLPLWLVMILVIVIPLIINKLLKKYNLEHDDLSVFFRGKKK